MNGVADKDQEGDRFTEFLIGLIGMVPVQKLIERKKDGDQIQKRVLAAAGRTNERDK